MDYWRMREEELFSSLGSSRDGLSSREAKERLRKYGMNEIEPPDRRTPLRILFSQFQNPLIYILIIATIIAFFLGEGQEAAIIIAIVIVNAALGFAQEYRSEKALEELRKYISMTAHVLRDGQAIEINTKLLVPGDIIFISTGDIIPADARLLEANGLEANESVLTGESNPVPKNPLPFRMASPPVSGLSNMVLMGSTITAGYGKAVVVSTGESTYMGKSAGGLRAPAPQTNFERSIRAFGDMLLKVIIAMTFFIFVINAALGHGLLTSFLFALAIAVGITPELLPIIITIGLSQGSMRLVQKHVAVKRLQAIEDLGNIDILCADKTGTLTENEVSLVRYVDANGKENDEILLYSLLCNSAVVQHGKVKGGTIDSAIWRYAMQKFQLKRLDGYSWMGLVAFDYERKRMSVVAGHAKGRLFITKGAFESVLPICTKILISGREIPIRTYSEKLKKMCEGFGQEGYRVVAVAYKRPGKKEEYTPKDEEDMVFMGLLLLLDPPKKDTVPALEHFRRLGVEIYVLTGDGPLITAHICRQVGVEVWENRVVTGAEISGMDDSSLQEHVKKYNVYARLTPSDKLRIVRALKTNGHVVGFIGDGVNDAPSLRAADVGISVKNGADIAKDAADVVLLRKSLNVIANGISEGRGTFSNIMKYIRNTISANFGNMWTLSLSSLFLPFIPLLPSQILLNNFLSDIPLVSISADSVDKDELKKPRKWDIKGITRFMVFFGAISSVFDLITMAFIILVLGAGEALFHTVWFLESILSEIIVVFAIRTAKPFYKSMPSPILLSLTILIAAVSIAIVATPIASTFEFSPLDPFNIGVVFAIVFSYFIIVEITKNFYYAKYGHD